MSIPLHVQIPCHLYDRMLNHAVAELPNECCGLLAGQILEPGPIGRVLQVYALVNAKASPTEYESEPRSMFQAVRDIEKMGWEILAVYHSHPTSDPVPSRKDVARNYSPEVMNLIISLKSSSPAVSAWWLSEDGYREAQWEVS